MLLKLFTQIIQFQIDMFSGGIDAAVFAVAIFDVLFAYAIFTAGSERKPIRRELLIVTVIALAIAWATVELVDKAMMEVPIMTAGGM